MDQRSGQKRAVDYLYPTIEPFDQRVIEVSDGHRVFVEQCGNPQGVPVLVLHGGPGGGCSPAMRRYFDPSHYRVVLFDQRGCGRSRPHASVEANTTWHLLDDIETIRNLLEIDQFVLFGGSWGATLALIYAIKFPERVSAMVLRGVFLMTQAELDWFYGGGAGAFYPELWQRFLAPIPDDAPTRPIDAYHRLLFSGNLAEEIRAGRAWSGWENALASVHGDGTMMDGPAEYARAFARLENHYFVNGGFLESDGWILANAPAIAHIPATIVQGRFDMICPPTAAWKLARLLPKARLHMVPMAGHALSEPGISEALVHAMNNLRG
ncbi:MAG: prolyl aminopeptidase [Rhodobacteraceae bacterium]|nr:prolyl aminopeptidase [Paracoccaceae bacterium]